MSAEVEGLPSVKELFDSASEMEMWLYAEAEKYPELIEILAVTEKLIKDLVLLRFVSAAFEKAPKRNISGKGGVVELLGLPPSSLHLWIHRNIERHALRLCKGNADAALSISPWIQIEARDFLKIRKQHEKEIQEWRAENLSRQKSG